MPYIMLSLLVTLFILQCAITSILSFAPSVDPSTIAPSTRSPTYSRKPTISPSTIAPSYAPSTIAPSTASPTTVGTGYCPAYSASGSSSYAVCSITACSGDTVTMTMCSPGSYNGDTYLILYDPFTQSPLASDYEDSGSLCSHITYTFNSTCQAYDLREGCDGSGSCSGTVYYSGSSASVSPSSIPTTTAPSVAPSTIAPSLIPSTSPSIDPTLAAVNSNGNDQLSAGAIAGITIGVIVGIIATVVAVFYFSSTAMLSLESATELSTMKNPRGEDSELL